jgi:hypothetical protein
MRLIDGSFLEDRCKRQMNDEWNKKAAPSSWADAYEQFLTDIENAPTVGAVPVVRCSECKYNNNCFTQGFVESEGVLPFDRNTWVCADGERKGGDE